MSVVYDTSETSGKTFIMTSELLGLQVFTPGSGLSSSLYSPYTRRVNGFLGNLVIALPCSHEGGQLSVMIRGESVTFDWSSTDMDSRAGKCMLLLSSGQ